MPHFFFHYSKDRTIEPENQHVLLQKVIIIEMQEGMPLPSSYRKCLYFIKKGVLRCYLKTGESEWTRWFAAEGSWISLEDIFYNNILSEHIESCSSATLYRITKEDYELLLKQFPELREDAFTRFCSKYHRFHG